MKKLTILVFILAFSFAGFSQTISFSDDGRCVIDDGQKKTTLVQARDEIGDFTITDSEGITWNLYDLLGQGKTVFLDLFFST